jgi:hypothetical protein
MVITNPHLDPEVFAEILQDRFPDAKFAREMVERLISDAETAAFKVTLNEDYIIEDGNIELIDRDTACLHLGCRWSGFLRSMVEIKEGQAVNPPTIPISSICHRDFFMLYNGLCCVTGTMGDIHERSILSRSYNVNMFQVPCICRCIKQMVVDRREKEVKRSFDMIAEEAKRIAADGRPVLIIFDYPREVDEFAAAFFPSPADAGRIKGLNPMEDRLSIEVAGQSGRITIATVIAGRGTDIKMDRRSQDLGGLYVLIAKVPPTRRGLEQIIRRTARQGRRGAARILLESQQRFYEVINFYESEKNTYDLQRKFTSDMKALYPWLFENEPHRVIPHLELRFGCNYIDALSNCAGWILTHFAMVGSVASIRNQEISLTSCLHYMITLSWGIRIDEIKQNPHLCKSETNRRIIYEKFLSELHKFLSKDAKSSFDLFESIRQYRVWSWLTNASPGEIIFKICMVEVDIALIVCVNTRMGLSGRIIVGAMPVLIEATENVIEEGWMDHGFDMNQVRLDKVLVRANGGGIRALLPGHTISLLASGGIDSIVADIEGAIDNREFWDNIRQASSAFHESVCLRATATFTHRFGQKIHSKLGQLRKWIHEQRARQQAVRRIGDRTMELDDEDLKTVFGEITWHESVPQK